MSDKFRKSFRSLLACGKFNPARQSAAAMAATMATDVKSETLTNRQTHAIYYSAGVRRRSSPTNPNQLGCVTALALVEIPKAVAEKDENQLTIHDSNSTSSLACKVDRLSSSSEAASNSSSHQSCARHRGRQVNYDANFVFSFIVPMPVWNRQLKLSIKHTFTAYR